MLIKNSIAPAFALPDQENVTHKLADYAGKWVVLYFYPKDDTPGCTKEACNFRDNGHQFAQKGVVILGVSKDTVASHKKFGAKYHLTFPLLADPEKKVIKAYEAWGIKKFMGREFEGTKRITYLIDPKGVIVKAYDKVNPLSHAGKILEDLNIIKG